MQANAILEVCCFKGLRQCLLQVELSTDHHQALRKAVSAGEHALNQQKLVYAGEIAQAASIHRRFEDHLLQKLADAESEAFRVARANNAEWRPGLKVHDEIILGGKS